jgi:hypothetical protein
MKAVICKTASEYVARAIDGSLSISERVGLWVHAFFCGPCRRYRRDAVELHACCLVHLNDVERESDRLPATPTMPDIARDRIAAAIAAAIARDAPEA